MKTCFKCKQSKPIAEFYKHSAMGDGYLGKCKECTKRDVHEHRLKNLDKIQEYDRMRGLLEHRKEGVKRRASRYVRDMKFENAKYPEHRQARIIAGNAIAKGILIPQSCERCGAKKTHAHHEAYSKPLRVNWLYTACHGKRHREITAERRAKSKRLYPGVVIDLVK